MEDYELEQLQKEYEKKLTENISAQNRKTKKILIAVFGSLGVVFLLLGIVFLAFNVSDDETGEVLFLPFVILGVTFLAVTLIFALFIPTNVNMEVIKRRMTRGNASVYDSVYLIAALAKIEVLTKRVEMLEDEVRRLKNS
ncbi:MAG: hypothetical protein IJR55_07150 [Clostridia bacterium]|nr:hypothetical protein [Clostridia bacterium]